MNKGVKRKVRLQKEWKVEEKDVEGVRMGRDETKEWVMRDNVIGRNEYYDVGWGREGERDQNEEI